MQKTQKNRKKTRYLIPYLVLIIFPVLIISWIFVISQKNEEALPVIGQVPDFSFIDRNGNPYSQDDLEGKITIVDFIFTKCQGACPVMGTHMQELYHRLKSYPDVQFLSISVDPERDSLSVLKKYAKSLGVEDHRWRFVRGSIDNVVELSENGFFLAAENLPMGHSTKFVLVDPEGNIRAYFDGLDSSEIEPLMDAVQTLQEKENQ